MSGIDLECRSFIVRGKHLAPADIHAEAWLDACRQGQEVAVRLWKPRNMGQHRKLFAVLHKVVENSDVWQDEEALRQAVCIACGHVESRQQADGSFAKVAASMSVASMPGEAFTRFFNRAIYVLTQISGMSEEDLLRDDRKG